MTTRVETLGAWVSELRYEDVPHGLRAKLKDHILDTVGAAIVGDGRTLVTIAEHVYRTPGTTPVLVNASARHLVDAARLSAIAAHAAEIDDTEGCDHTGAIVVPVVLALASTHGLDGRTLLTATVAGYEVGRRVQNSLGGYDPHNQSGWHSTATCGVFAAAAAAARALGLSPSQSAHALALAASSSAGSWAFATDGSMSKQLHVGNAAANGLQAALLAQAGATGPMHIFEPVWGGFFQTHGNGDVDADELVAGLAGLAGAGAAGAEAGAEAEWHAAHSAIKLYAACRSAHPPIEALLDALREGHYQREDVEQITIELSPFLREMICQEKITSPEAARMSLPLSLAFVLHGVALDPDTYEQFDNPELLRELTPLLERVEVQETDELANLQTVRLTVHTSHGTFVTAGDTARGSEHLPLSSHEVVEKFTRLTTPIIGTARAAELVIWAARLDATGDTARSLPAIWE